MLHYVRLYTDEAGESRIEDIVIPGRTQHASYDPNLVTTLSDLIPATDVFLRDVVKEASSTEPHNAPRRQFIVLLTGESEVETSTGEKRRFGPGAMMLLEDTYGKGHITRGLSSGERLTLVIGLPDDPTAWNPVNKLTPRSDSVA